MFFLISGQFAAMFLVAVYKKYKLLQSISASPIDNMIVDVEVLLNFVALEVEPSCLLDILSVTRNSRCKLSELLVVIFARKTANKKLPTKSD